MDDGVRGRPGPTYRAAANLGVRARFGRPARSQAGVAGGRCGRRRTALTRGVGLSVGRRARAAGRVTRRRGVGRALGPCWRGGKKTGAGRARLQAECGAGRGRGGELG